MSKSDVPGPGQYRCECCGGIFNKGWSDEEADAEAKEKFGDIHGEDDLATVCDDCWKAMGFGDNQSA